MPLSQAGRAAAGTRPGRGAQTGFEPTGAEPSTGAPARNGTHPASHQESGHGSQHHQLH